MTLVLTGPGLEADGNFPPEHTCEGRDRSPALRWEAAPPETRSLAVTVVDLDHPDGGPFAHWLIYDLPAGLEALPNSIPSSLTPPIGGIQGRNDFRRIGWSGPCPPAGGPAHRYRIRLRCLDVESCGAGPGATLARLEEAIEGHVLAEASLILRCAREARPLSPA